MALGAACLLLSQETARARCSVPSFTFWLGNPGTAVMNADTGQPCNIRVWQGIGSDFRSVTMARAPAHGSVAPRDDRNMVYRSRPGFQGEDSFIIAIKGTKFGAEQTTHLTVNVTVARGAPLAVQSTAGKMGPRASTAPVRQAAARQRQAAAPNALLNKCLRDAGAGPDPVTGRMMFHNSPGRMDQFKLCLANGDRRKANTIAIPEISMTHPGDRYGLKPRGQR
jgi:hypothetical protein